MSPDPTRLALVATRGLCTLAAAGLVVVSLASCTGVDPVAAPSTTPTSAAQGTATPTASPTATAPALVSTPYRVDCSTLLDPASLDTYYPGLTTTTAVEPEGGTTLDQVADADGTICSWQDSSGAVVTVGVAHFDADSLDSLANELVATSNSVPTFGVEGYFDTPGDVGIAEAFSSPAFVVAESTTFREPGDAEPVVSAVLDSVASTG